MTLPLIPATGVPTEGVDAMRLIKHLVSSGKKIGLKTN